MKLIILIALILILTLAGCTSEKCVEKDGMCCMWGKCNTAEVPCTEDSQPIFMGCSDDCQAQMACIPLPDIK
jgi:hypothetical protein